MQQKIRLILVEDEALVRKAICALLELEESLTVVGEADTGEAAVRKARLLKPDVILLDLHLPDRAGVEVIAELLHHTPTLQVLILTAYATDREVVAAFQAGAVGYVLKTQAITELVRAIQQAAQGQTSLPPTVAHILLRQLKHADSQPANIPLSQAEQRVLMLVAQGFANKEIARTFSLSRATVSAHVSHILSKLQLANRTQVAHYALQQGWVVYPPPPTRPPQRARVALPVTA